VSSAFYHGDLSYDSRQRVHAAWVEGRVSVIVATVAFGMGINRGDVRFVIHAGLPASLHHYYQEAGRAVMARLHSACCSTERATYPGTA